MKGHIRRGRIEGTWYLRVELDRSDNGKRRQKRVTVRGTNADAQRRLRKLLTDLETGGYVDTARLTVGDLLRQWLSSREQRVQFRTYQRYEEIVRLYLLPTCGSVTLAKLSPSSVEQALKEWRSGGRHDGEPGRLSSRSLKHVFDTLKSACLWGVRSGLLARNPVAPVDPPAVERREMTALDPEGVARLLNAASGTELLKPILVAVGTGLRCGELLALRWSDVDLDAGRLYVRRSVENAKGELRYKQPKTSRSARTLSLAAFVVDALCRHRAVQNERRIFYGLGRDDSALIFDREDCSPWNPASFSFAFAKFIRKSGLPKVRFHDLRHSHATLLLRAGVDLKTISATLGHSTISMTGNVYLHAAESLQQAAVSRLDEMLSPAVGGVFQRASVPQRCHTKPSLTKSPS